MISYTIGGVILRPNNPQYDLLESQAFLGQMERVRSAQVYLAHWENQNPDDFSIFDKEDEHLIEILADYNKEEIATKLSQLQDFERRGLTEVGALRDLHMNKF